MAGFSLEIIRWFFPLQNKVTLLHSLLQKHFLCGLTLCSLTLKYIVTRTKREDSTKKKRDNTNGIEGLMYTDLMSISWIVTECAVIFNKEKYFAFNQEQTKTPKNFAKIRFEIELQIFKELLVLQERTGMI